MARIIKFSSNHVVIATDNDVIELNCQPPNNFDEEILEKIWEDVDE